MPPARRPSSRSTSTSPEPPYLYINAQGYREKRYRGPTPAQAPAGKTLDTAGLVALLAEKGAGNVALVDVQAVPVRAEAAEFGLSWLPSETRYHLPGSIWLPNVGAVELDEVMSAYFQRELENVTGGDRSHALVLYCVLDCWMSWNAVLRASRYGYTDVYWYRAKGRTAGRPPGGRWSRRKPLEIE